MKLITEYEVITTYIPHDETEESKEIFTFGDKNEAISCYNEEIADIENGEYDHCSTMTSIVLIEKVYQELSCTPLQRKNWE